MGTVPIIITPYGLVETEHKTENLTKLLSTEMLVKMDAFLWRV